MSAPFHSFILYYAFFPEGFSSFFSSVWTAFFSSGFSVFSGFSSLSTLPSKASSKVASNLVLFKSSSLFSFPDPLKIWHHFPCGSGWKSVHALNHRFHGLLPLNPALIFQPDFCFEVIICNVQCQQCGTHITWNSLIFIQHFKFCNLIIDISCYLL